MAGADVEAASMKTFRPYQPDQMLPSPPSIEEWLPEVHLARLVREVVATLDLLAIEDAYTEDRGKCRRTRAPDESRPRGVCEAQGDRRTSERTDQASARVWAVPTVWRRTRGPVVVVDLHRAVSKTAWHLNAQYACRLTPAGTRCSGVVMPTRPGASCVERYQHFLRASGRGYSDRLPAFPRAGRGPIRTAGHRAGLSPARSRRGHGPI